MDYAKEKEADDSGKESILLSNLDTPRDTRPNSMSVTEHDTQHSDSDDTRISNLDGSSPILKLYLNFDTPLPNPSSTASLSKEQRDELPKTPDLRRYDSPLTWSPARKACLLFMSCASTFVTAYSAGSYSPPSSLIASDLHVSQIAVLVGITTFCVGFSFAPMALAPFSELWGRYPVFVFAGIVFVVFQSLCSVMPTLAGMLIARFLVGCGGSVFSSVMAGVLADVWTKEERNTAMAIFSGAVLAGTGAGPLVGTVFVEMVKDKNLAWRWCFWHQGITGALVVGAIIVFFRESRASVLLTRRAQVLNEWYEKLEKADAYGVQFRDVSLENELIAASLSAESAGVEMRASQGTSPQSLRIRWIVKEDADRPALRTMIAISLQRPFYLLFTEPVVFCFSLWAAFSWGILYLSFAVVPYLYGTDLDMASRTYVAITAAGIVATAVSIRQDRLLKHPQWIRRDNLDVEPYSDSKFWAFMRRRFPAEAPEARLYFSCITCLFLPIGLLIGFVGPEANTDVAVPIGLGFASWGIYSVYLASFNYLADSYNLYASSALAAQSFARNMMGGSFPLFTGLMFDRLGLRAAGGLLGGVALLLSFTPWVLVAAGEKIRGRSKVMTALKQ